MKAYRGKKTVLVHYSPPHPAQLAKYFSMGDFVSNSESSVLEFRDISQGLESRDLVFAKPVLWPNYVMFLQRWYCKLIYNKVK
jgi:hypothetical protein